MPVHICGQSDCRRRSSSATPGWGSTPGSLGPRCRQLRTVPSRLRRVARATITFFGRSLGDPRLPRLPCARRRRCEATVPAEYTQAGQESRFPAPDVDARRTLDRERAPAPGPAPPDRLTWRIRDRTTFAALRASPRRGRRGPITVTWVPDGAGTPPRVAYSIGRQVGSAVVRNRLRRRLRAAAGELGLGPGAYLISAAPPAAGMTFGELRESVREAAKVASGKRGPR